VRSRIAILLVLAVALGAQCALACAVNAPPPCHKQAHRCTQAVSAQGPSVAIDFAVSVMTYAGPLLETHESCALACARATGPLVFSANSPPVLRV